MKWEYKVVTREEEYPETLEDVLNQFGKDGWKCFQVDPWKVTNGMLTMREGWTLYLKRQAKISS